MKITFDFSGTKKKFQGNRETIQLVINKKEE